MVEKPEIGLLGKPSAGKSTFFSASTLATVPISEVPFTTIEPNVGTAYVRVEDIGPEFGVVSQPREGYIMGKWRFVPIKLIDVAGLVPEAHKGRGLGNKFLSDLNLSEGLLHIIDFSGYTDERGNKLPEPTHDPEDDIKFLERELDHWYADVLKNNLKKVQSQLRAGKKLKEAIATILSGMRVKEEHVEELLSEMGEEWERWDFLQAGKFLREKAKPIIHVANKIDFPSAKRNYKRLEGKYDLIPASAEAELALKRASKLGLIKYIPGEGDFEVIKPLTKEQEEALERIRKTVLEPFKSTGVQKALEKMVFEKLRYIAVFPAGSKLQDKEGRYLPDCFLLKEGSTIKDFARAIHTELEKGLLYGIDARSKKRLSKDYVLKHRDAIEIVSTSQKA